MAEITKPLDEDDLVQQVTSDENEGWMDVNGYHVIYDEIEGYKGYIAPYTEDDLVYQIKPNGLAYVRTKNGEKVILDNISINDFNQHSVFKGVDGKNYLFSNGAITMVKGYDEEYDALVELFYNSDNKITRLYDKNTNKLISETTFYNNGNFSDIIYTDNSVEYYNNGELYCIKYDDGLMEYPDGEDKLVIYPDGTYANINGKGKYIIDDDGNIICYDNNGNQVFYNMYGQKYQMIDQNGKTIMYDVKKDMQITSKNGENNYTKMNHIEYDEDAYLKILNTLNGIDGNSVINGCSNIENVISSFPDSYSSGINSIESDIEEHTNLIKTLSETTNYSLLAYDTCDEELRDGLYLLIDSLFGDNELTLASKFKSDIKSVIEDRDNDNILEYKEGTNFRMLSNNVIVSSIYTDEDGNKWYLNKRNRVIGLDGKNIKLNYGGETFNVKIDENGIIRLTDSKGNPLDIFGDYNIESGQYGGDQKVFSNYISEYPDSYVQKIVDEYFPNANSEQISYLLFQVGLTSCGNTAISNLVFKKFEGNESGFYDTFGYPMYDIVKTENGLSLDYNYEPMIMDLFCHERTSNGEDIRGVNNTSMSDWGTRAENLDSMEAYLQEKYNVSLNGFDKPFYYYGETGYILYNMDGSVNTPVGMGHAMIGVEKLPDGRVIVSSNGKKLILELSTNPIDREYGQQYYREYK